MSDSNLIISAYGLLEITFVFVKPVWFNNVTGVCSLNGIDTNIGKTVL